MKLDSLLFTYVFLFLFYLYYGVRMVCDSLRGIRCIVPNH